MEARARGGPISRMNATVNSIDQIVTLRIELLDTDPLIWRQVEVPTSITLKVLHDVVQAAMGWWDQHLWAFRQGDRTYGPAILREDGGPTPVLKAETVRLRDIVDPGETVLDYIYDFGDNWEHRLTFTEVRQGDPNVEYPRYVAGKRAAPPEDCGGIPGFYGGLEVLADREHPDHADVADWFGDYDPESMDQFVIEIALNRIARRRNAAKATAARKARS